MPDAWLDVRRALRQLIAETLHSQRKVVEAINGDRQGDRRFITEDALSKALIYQRPMARHQFDHVLEVCLPHLAQGDQEERRSELQKLWEEWERSRKQEEPAPKDPAVTPQQFDHTLMPVPRPAEELEKPPAWSVSAFRRGYEQPTRGRMETAEFYQADYSVISGLEPPLNTPLAARPRIYLSTMQVLACIGSMYWAHTTLWLMILLGLFWLTLMATELPLQLHRYPLQHVHSTPPEAAHVPKRWRRPGQPELAWYVGGVDREAVRGVVGVRPAAHLFGYRPMTGWLRLSAATPGVRVHWAIEDLTHGGVLARGTLGGRRRIAWLRQENWRYPDYWRSLARGQSEALLLLRETVRSLERERPQVLGLVLGTSSGSAKVSWHAPAVSACTGRFSGSSPAIAWWWTRLRDLLQARGERIFARKRPDLAYQPPAAASWTSKHSRSRKWALCSRWRR